MGGVLEHVSLPEAVSRTLRHRILNNELQAETRLVEASLAAEFGVSRGTIRDAMRDLQAEGLIEIVPRRYSLVTRMSIEDAEDVCFVRYVLEDASFDCGFGPNHAELVEALEAELERMSQAAGDDDLEALVQSDTRFHELLVNVGGRRRLKDLWSVLNSQMGAVMRVEMERQDIDLFESVRRHLPILEAVRDRDITRLHRELRGHYLANFPSR
jgi:DNA-binding GntR family transcriptional regulator